MKIMCMETSKLPTRITQQTIASKESIFELIDESNISWIERDLAEKDVRYKQIIPYILLKNEKGQFVCYQRHGTETRLHNKYSAGVGGHIDEPDNKGDITKTIEAGMFRELGEELCNFQPNNVILEYLGIINEIETEVGLMHIGVVYIARCCNGYIPESGSELQGMEWKTIEEISLLDKELWTELAFRLV